ncbi:MAG: hypothetical protein AAFQ71_11500 [Planctomycetota bacterium]
MTTIEAPLFDGRTFEAEFDADRLRGQLKAVFELMRDGCWRTLGEIKDQIGKGGEASISARLRDLRKDDFGGWDVERRRRGEPSDGLFEYRLGHRARRL